MSLLGTASDRVIAKRIGVSRYAVAEQRRRLGISRRPEPWAPDQMASFRERPATARLVAGSDGP